MASIEDLVEVFEDTENWCKHDEKLETAIMGSITATQFYGENEKPSIPIKRYEQTVILSVNIAAWNPLCSIAENSQRPGFVSITLPRPPIPAVG